VDQEVLSPAFGYHQGVPQPEHPYSLKKTFPFHWVFSDLLLSGSDLERERDRELKERKESFGSLKSGSAHIALAVWYKPLASI
jgi:hypothetical protein